MNLPRYVTCPECKRRFDMYSRLDRDEYSYGHDCEDTPDADTCPDCQGSGYIPAIGPDAPDSGYVECDTCHGTGSQ